MQREGTTTGADFLHRPAMVLLESASAARKMRSSSCALGCEPPSRRAGNIVSQAFRLPDSLVRSLA